MRFSKSIVYKLILIASLGLSTGSSAAQQGDVPNEFPTVTALETTVVLQADPIALAQRLRGAGEIPPPPDSATTRLVGEQQNFWVIDSGAEREFQISATLRVVGDHIYLWVEDGATASDADLKALANAFDQSVYVRVRELWGSEAMPGVDGDPRLYGLFAHGLGSGVAAYFFSRHTFPVQVYPTSNQHEMFFFNLDAINPRDINSVEVVSTIAHEFQHMIRANIQDNDAIWLNEGLSTFTQLYLYKDAGAVLSFLGAPGTQLNTWSEDGPRAPHYGGAMLFVTYFYERYGLDALQQLSIDPGTGLDSFNSVLESLNEPGVNELFADWVVANYLLDPEIGDGRYGYQLLPVGAPLITPLATLSNYPYLASSNVSQYASDYYRFIPGDAAALDIKFAVPETVMLIPTDTHSGSWMWYSNRGDMSDMTLTQAFDLSTVEHATLNYHAWYDIEDGWDYGYVMVSADDGATWDVLPTAHTTSDDPHTTAYGPGYSGESGGWVDEQISLDDYAGGHVLIRFEMITDDAVSQPGLAIDDVSIPEIGYTSDFEMDGGGWESNGWLRTDNRLPQGVWLQAIQQVAGDISVTRWLAPVESHWSLPVLEGAEEIILIVSPFAPVTTVPTQYTLSVSAK